MKLRANLATIVIEEEVMVAIQEPSGYKYSKDYVEHRVRCAREAIEGLPHANVPRKQVDYMIAVLQLKAKTQSKRKRK